MEPNQQNKQAAKYNQRHWNKEQADSDQREEGEDNGAKGEGVSMNMYKGYMGKAKGESDWRWEVVMGGAGREWWGWNGDNCDWTTI